jgi:hypothetical protein
VVDCRNNNALVRFIVAGPMVFIVVPASGFALVTLMLVKSQKKPGLFENRLVVGKSRGRWKIAKRKCGRRRAFFQPKGETLGRRQALC